MRLSRQSLRLGLGSGPVEGLVGAEEWKLGLRCDKVLELLH